MEFSHTSVMLEETIEQLNIRKGCTYLDGTLGGAGHACEILKKLAGTGHLYGTDQDATAIKVATERLSGVNHNFTVIRDNFQNAVQDLKNRDVEGLDGILLDLGVSSYQLDNAERGFSYRFDAPLDMRMDEDSAVSAWNIVNEYSEMELFRIIKNYGEDRFAKNIAKHIVQARKDRPIETTFELNELIRISIPAKMREKSGHPSKRTFQAIRIECNRELEVLKESLDDMADFLNEGGRFCIITFHSLEDRIVKEAFRRWERPCVCPPDFPVCVCGKKSLGKVITGKPIQASTEELERNSRAASAKLRVFKKGN